MQHCTAGEHLAVLKSNKKDTTHIKTQQNIRNVQTKHATATADNLALSGVEMRRKI